MRIYIGNIPYDTEEDEFRMMIEEKVGQLAEFCWPIGSNGFRGFAFAQFESDDLGRKAIDFLNDMVYEGRRLRACLAMPRMAR